MAFRFGVASAIAVVQFASMAFLIIACVTAPVFSQIGLSKYNDTVYGTFGYCNGKGCSSAGAIYDVQSLNSDGNWKLNDTAREKLAKILIVTPIAAGLTFFAMILNTLCQFGSIGARGGIFIANLLLTLLAFAASALACIVVFLLFYPNMTWCSWLLIPAAAVNLLCVPLTYLVHSQASSSEPDDEDSLNDARSTDIDEVKTHEPSSRLGLFEQNHDLSANDAEKDFMAPNYYKGPQIMTSTTLTSSMTADSTSDREALSKQRTADPYSVFNRELAAGAKQPEMGLGAARAEPYSAIQHSQSSVNADGKKIGYTPTKPVVQRQYSDTSSYYSENPAFSRQGTMNTSDLKPASALDVSDKGGQEKASSQEVLQGIIKGAISEEDDEDFLKQQTIDPRERPALDDDDGIQDNGSDFTSVSQRGINPHYMGYAAAGGKPQVMPYPQQHPRANFSGQPVYAPQNKQMPPHPGHGFQSATNLKPRANVAPPMPQSYQYQPSMGYRPQHVPMSAPVQRPVTSNNTSNPSDVLLNTNPDFAVAGPRSNAAVGANKWKTGINAPPSGVPMSTTHYKPAYKKRVPRPNVYPSGPMNNNGMF